MQNTIQNQKGFSLLDAVLGLMVMAVGFVGIMPLMSNATTQTLATDHFVTASQLANEKIESIIADKEFKGIQTVTGQAYPTEYLSGAYNGYSRSVSVTEVSKTDLSTPQAGTNYKKVDVVVSWGQTPNDRITVSTLLTNI